MEIAQKHRHHCNIFDVLVQGSKTSTSALRSLNTLISFQDYYKSAQTFCQELITQIFLQRLPIRISGPYR
jgi:hypothetical protein